MLNEKPENTIIMLNEKPKNTTMISKFMSSEMHKRSVDSQISKFLEILAIMTKNRQSIFPIYFYQNPGMDLMVFTLPENQIKSKKHFMYLDLLNDIKKVFAENKGVGGCSQDLLNLIHNVLQKYYELP
jgi:hypothetical protein